MLEVNPLVDGVALDCVAAVTDDDANYRRSTTFSERTLNRKATAREIAARKIDENDHRGVAGKTYMDLDGDIGIMTSGGGATMTLMDACNIMVYIQQIIRSTAGTRRKRKWKH